MSEFFIVATPIGNLSDITLRALETLKLCDIIICEDTRITSRLLEKYEIKNKKLSIYNDNSQENSRNKILAELQKGLKVALVSDAGTPLISDPGYKLVSFLRNHNIKITPIPGASSVISALCASGIACDNFLFLGFLPSAKIQRQNALKELPKNYTLVFFESPQRIIEMLEDIDIAFGNRKIAVARELTKIHEEIISAPTKEVIDFFKKNEEKIRGEFVVIIEKANRKEKNLTDEELEIEIKKALKSGVGIKDLSENLAQIYSLNKKEVYQLALSIKQKEG